MSAKDLFPQCVFEASWEVCNKVGGIYTVLSTRAKTLQEALPDQVFFIGPDLRHDRVSDFREEIGLLPEWKATAAAAGIGVRIGRWEVPGRPVALLVDFLPYFALKNNIYTWAWEQYKVDSLRAYGDYDEASMFSYAAGLLVATLSNAGLLPQRTIFQAHEWMTGLGMLYVKQNAPKVATIFTTHATAIGRSICSNNKPLYDYFEGYHGDQMARELSMEAKHSIEKRTAHEADCFTTVSEFTNRECRQLLDKAADVVLPNGFENSFVPKGAAFTAKRRKARAALFHVIECLTGEALPADTLIVSTSGRNDFRCKGFDVYLESLRQLKEQLHEGHVLALIEVPCWIKEARQDLAKALAGASSGQALPQPYVTHELYNNDSDRILCMMQQLGLTNAPADRVKVMLIPCYLDGHDGIFNIPYYDLLTANDLCLYPSYYEPWGYTPLESCAFHTPCATTNLSGFGQWVDNLLGHEGTLADGVAVLDRNDSNYFEVAAAQAACIRQYLAAPKKQRDEMRRRAANIADQAQWKHFFAHYCDAYVFAFEANQKRRKAKH